MSFVAAAARAADPCLDEAVAYPVPLPATSIGRSPARVPPNVRYRVAWRRRTGRGDVRGTLLQCVRAVDGARAAGDLVGGLASSAWCGEFRVEGTGGLVVYTTAALIRAWDDAVHPLPRSASHSLWEHEVRRRVAHARLTVDLRAALSRAVDAGLLDQRLASRLVRTAESAIIADAPA